MPTVRFSRLDLEVDVPRGATLREAAMLAGAPVGARCTAGRACTTCRVGVRKGAEGLAPSPTGSSCLACTTSIVDGLVELDVDAAAVRAYLASVSGAERVRVERLLTNARGADERPASVPRAAIEDLLASIDDCAGRETGAARLVDIDVAARTAGRFKLDVSFAFTSARHARFSVNDKGEPEAFRERLLGAATAFHLDPARLRTQLAIAAPGVVQTTVGVKWRAEQAIPERVSLYFEELTRSADHPRIRSEVFGLLGVPAPPIPAGALPIAVCIDYSEDRLVAVKSYDAVADPNGGRASDVTEDLRAVRDALPFHPARGTRRYMLATRWAPGGVLTGRKLLWMTELHRASLLPWAWAEVDRVRESVARDVDPAAGAALDRLRASWAHAPDAFLFPDLVAFNVGGGDDALIVHVSTR
jgi:ferredoxin